MMTEFSFLSEQSFFSPQVYFRDNWMQLAAINIIRAMQHIFFIFIMFCFTYFF